MVSSGAGNHLSFANHKATASQDNSALNSHTTDLSALESAIRQLPDIDAARVVELHNRIMAGEYQIDAERLAHKILALESSLDR